MLSLLSVFSEGPSNRTASFGISCFVSVFGASASRFWVRFGTTMPAARLGLCVVAAALAVARGAPLAQGTSEQSALVSPGLGSRLTADEPRSEQRGPAGSWAWVPLLHGSLFNDTAPAATNRTTHVLAMGAELRRPHRQEHGHVARQQQASAQGEPGCVPALGTALHAESFTWLDALMLLIGCVSPPFLLLYTILEGKRASSAGLLAHAYSFTSHLPLLRSSSWCRRANGDTSDAPVGEAPTEEHTAANGEITTIHGPPVSCDLMPMSFKGGLSLIFEGVGQPPDVALHLLHELVEKEYAPRAMIHGPPITHHDTRTPDHAPRYTDPRPRTTIHGPPSPHDHGTPYC
jgi:hypothetical protein